MSGAGTASAQAEAACLGLTGLERSLLVIIPACNERETLPEVLERLFQLYPQVPVVVVDDGSSDGTGDVALALGALVLRHEVNRGYGEALLTGYRFALHARVRVVLQLDADGQHPPEEIPRLLDALEEGVADLVVGSRYSGRGSFMPGALKQVGLAFLRPVIQALTGMKLRDPTSGFRALSRRCIERCLEFPFPPDYPDSDVLIRLHRAGIGIREVPVVMHPSPRPSKLHSGLRPLGYAWRTLWGLSALMTKPHTGLKGLRTHAAAYAPHPLDP